LGHSELKKGLLRGHTEKHRFQCDGKKNREKTNPELINLQEAFEEAVALDDPLLTTGENL